MEVTRYNFSIDAIPTALKNRNLGSAHFKYGLVPLELVYSQGIKDLHYGATYMSLATHFIPRAIYPEKPDSGGVIFTDAYYRDIYSSGTSNLATGLLPEAFINFSFIGGILFSIFAFVIMFVPLLKYYTCKIRDKGSGFYSILKFPVYILICNGIGSILLVEFTNLFMGLIIKVVFIVLMVCALRTILGSVAPCVKVRAE